MSLVSTLCSRAVKERNLDVNNEEDRRCLHVLCYMTIGATIALGFGENNSTIIIHGEHGPFIPEVEEWCNGLITLNY